MNIAILGTGAVGTRLGSLFLSQGHQVKYGSRNPAAAEANVPAPSTVGSYAEAVAFGEVIVLATPWAGATGRTTLDILQGAGSFRNKVVIDATNPLNPDWSPVILGAETSAGEEVAKALPDAYIVKAFNTVFADTMTPKKLTWSGRRATLFLCGNNVPAKQVVMSLAEEIGFTPLDTGPLTTSRYLEAMAFLNIQIAVTMGGGTQAAFLYANER